MCRSSGYGLIALTLKIVLPLLLFRALAWPRLVRLVLKINIRETVHMSQFCKHQRCKALLGGLGAHSPGKGLKMVHSES